MITDLNELLEHAKRFKMNPILLPESQEHLWEMSDLSFELKCFVGKKIFSYLNQRDILHPHGGGPTDEFMNWAVYCDLGISCDHGIVVSLDCDWKFGRVNSGPERHNVQCKICGDVISYVRKT